MAPAQTSARASSETTPSGAPSLQAQLASETVGTFILCITVLGNVVGGTSSTFAALSIASSLMIAIYALGDVSGAHLNPAVTAAITMSGNLPKQTAACFIAAQVAGGILAAGVCIAIFGQGVAAAPGAGHSVFQAGLAEVLYTCMLCFVVLNCACAKANLGNQYFGLSIGYVITAGGYAVGSVSGACFNPAVAIALDASAIKPYWSAAYTVFELVGAAIAVGLYRYVRPEMFGAAKSGFEALLSEALGTFFLVLTAGSVISSGSLSAALSIGSALMCMIYALGSASGAHFNPAVTAAILLSGRDKIDTTKALQYMGAQVSGAVLAGLTYPLMYGKAFPLAPTGAGWLPLCKAEILFTFVLCYVVLTVATVKQPSKDMFGLAIGMCVTVGGYAAGGVGGGVLNPAAAIGLATANAARGGSGFLNSLGFSGLELAGGALAAGLFKYTHPAEYAK